MNKSRSVISPASAFTGHKGVDPHRYRSALSLVIVAEIGIERTVGHSRGVDE